MESMSNFIPNGYQLHELQTSTGLIILPKDTSFMDRIDLADALGLTMTENERREAMRMRNAEAKSRREREQRFADAHDWEAIAKAEKEQYIKTHGRVKDGRGRRKGTGHAGKKKGTKHRPDVYAELTELITRRAVFSRTAYAKEHNCTRKMVYEYIRVIKLTKAMGV